MNPDLVPAGDGQLARLVDSWSHEKLFYVERYIDIFCTGMKNRWPNLVYADFLSGPGLCKDKDTGEEYSASPLLGVARREFQRVFLNDSDVDAAAALRARTADQPMGRITVISMDCNDAVDQARQFLFPPAQAGSTLGLAVIDPTAFQMRFDSIERLTRGLRLDLLVVFMSDFIRRFFSTAAFKRTMDSFYGVQDWQRFIDMRSSGLRVPYGDLLEVYEQQLRSIGYTQVDNSVRILKPTGTTLYHLVFASKHPRGGDFFKKISQRMYDNKRRLL